MAQQIKFETHGFDTFARDLSLLGPKHATAAGNAALRKATKVVEGAWKSFAPVGPGDGTRTYKVKSGETRTANYGKLRENIRTRKTKARAEHTLVYIVTTHNAFWGGFLEYGTEKMAPQPWAKPASDNSAQEAYDTLTKNLREQIEKRFKKLGGPL